MIAKRIFLAFILMAVMTALVTGVHAQSTVNGLGPQVQKHNDVTGSWIVNVSPTIQPHFIGLVTFTKDGGFTETNSLGIPLESPGHGVWVRTGHREFALMFLNLEVDANGNFAGTGKVRATLTLDDAGNEMNGPFQVEVFDPDGNFLFSDSGTVHATRINVEPLP